MQFEKRMNGGHPSIMLIPNENEMLQIDKLLGDCGSTPIELKGYLKMADGIGDAYLMIWNEKLNSQAEIPKKY